MPAFSLGINGLNTLFRVRVPGLLVRLSLLRGMLVFLGLAVPFLFLTRQIALHLLLEALLHFLDMLPLFRRKVGRELSLPLLSRKRTLLGLPLELLRLRMPLELLLLWVALKLLRLRASLELLRLRMPLELLLLWVALKLLRLRTSLELTLLWMPLELLLLRVALKLLPLELFHPDHLALLRRELLPGGFAPATLEFLLVVSHVELLALFPSASARGAACRATLLLLLPLAGFGVLLRPLPPLRLGSDGCRTREQCQCDSCCDSCFHWMTSCWLFPCSAHITEGMGIYFCGEQVFHPPEIFYG